MREILFRGKRTDTGEWVEGNLVWIKNLEEQPYQCFIISQLSYFEYGEFDEMYSVFHETLGQFTGLTDKNGTKIFEGDICQTKGFKLIDEKPFVIVWDKYYSGWYWQDLYVSKETYVLSVSVASITKVIGNIHDNPELLEGDNDKL